MRTRATVLSLLIVAACGGDDEAFPIDAPPAPIDAPDQPVDAGIDAPYAPPTMLSQTGLYSDIATKTIAAGVHEFLPHWQLWSDEAVKRRWIYLPPGATIDSADMDNWKFPVGTKLWKEFVRTGTRIETRYLEKIGPGNDWLADWYAVSFQWNVGETDAIAVPTGVIDDTGPNDIPGRSDCRKCHADTRIPSVVIGFSALQLDVPTPPAGHWNLAQLVADNRLTIAPPSPTGGVYFPLPAGDPAATAAIGYLHANCGNCHNPASDVQATVRLKLKLSVANLATWAATDTWTSTIDVPNQNGVAGATAIIEPGVPAQSALFIRLTTTGGQRMPPVGREITDPTGSETVRAWIAAMPPTP